MDTTQELKNLTSKLRRLGSKKSSVGKQAGKLANQLSGLDKEINNVEKEIQALSDGEILVSEHAMFRFCERYLEMDMEDVRKCILSDTVRAQIRVLGGKGKFPIGKGLYAVLTNNVVVTISEA